MMHGPINIRSVLVINWKTNISNNRHNFLTLTLLYNKEKEMKGIKEEIVLREFLVLKAL